MVAFAEMDILYTLGVPCGTGSCTTPTDALFGYRWDLYNDGTITDEAGTDLAPTGLIDADIDWLEAFDAIGTVPGSAVIGIIDSGIRATHEEFAGKVVTGYDFFDGDPDPADDLGHGTHVAGIAAGGGDDVTGVPGVAWMPEVQIASAKVCGYVFGIFYACPSSAIADGIRWATDNGANVLNLSLGGPQGSSIVQSALQYARQNGVLPICAAGNDAGAVGFPAAFPECVAVSSTNWSDELASYSNFGPQVELAAPGGDFGDPTNYGFILSAYNSSDSGYAWQAGTSMASPQVAGLAALLHALGVTDADAKVVRMRSTANDLGAPGDDELFGAGRINVYTAVADLVGAPTNQAPTASFTLSCTDLTCDFTDTSTDDQGVVVAWSWDLGDGNTSTEQNPSHTYAAEGTYTVTLSVTDDEGASGSASSELSVPIPNQPPTASFTSSCSGYTCDFTDRSTDGDGSVVAWSWDLGDGNTSTEQSPSHTYASVGTYTVTLTATDDDGAPDTTTGTVTAVGPNQPPVAGFTHACTGLACSFTDTSTDSDGTITNYEWGFGDGWGTTAQNPSHTYAAPGTYTVVHWVYDNGAASDTLSTDVTVFAPGDAPTASFTLSCTDLTCDFTDTSTDDQGAVVAWSWDFGDGNTSTEQNPSHTYAAGGTYTVTLTATDDVGASDGFSRDVIVPSGNQSPTASFTSSCLDYTCDFTDMSTDGDGSVVAWSWDFGDGNTSTEQSPSHTYASAGTYTVTLTATDDGGAPDTTTGTVTAVEPNQPPVAGFTYACTGLACSFTDTSTDSDGIITNYEWGFGDGWATTAQNPSHTYAAPGTYTVVHWVYDNGASSDTVSTDVTVLAPGEAPAASFTVSCTDLTCDFTDTSTDDQGVVVAWSWDFGDGNTSTEQNPSHTYAAGGTYTVTLTATDDVGASDGFSRDVIVPSGNQSPTASFTSSCLGYTCDFTDVSTDGDGSVVAWSWDFGDGNTSTEQSPSHTYASAGTYTVTLTATDDGGAPDTTTGTVTAVEPNQPPVARFTHACTGLACSFTDTSTESDGTITNYEWGFGDGWSTNAQNTSHTYAAPGTYTVVHSVYDNGAASDNVSVSIDVGEAPVASFSWSCADLTCDFTDASTDGDGTVVFWSWDFGDGTTSFAQNPSHTYAAAGTYTVTLAVQDNDGVTDTTTQTVDVSAPVNGLPTASFVADCTDLACDFTDTSTDVDGTMVVWSWDFGDGNTSTEQSPSHTYASAGTYTVTLTATDDDGAPDTTTQTVTVNAPPSQIMLSAVGSRVRGRYNVDLAWSGAASPSVDVYRGGALVFTTVNDGAETDAFRARRRQTYQYQVCEAGTTVCSGIVTVTS